MDTYIVVWGEKDPGYVSVELLQGDSRAHIAYVRIPANSTKTYAEDNMRELWVEKNSLFVHEGNTPAED